MQRSFARYGPTFRGIAYTEIWNPNTRGLDVVINLGRKQKLQVLVNVNSACFSSKFVLGTCPLEKMAGLP